MTKPSNIRKFVSNIIFASDCRNACDHVTGTMIYMQDRKIWKGRRLITFTENYLQGSRVVFYLIPFRSCLESRASASGLKSQERNLERTREFEGLLFECLVWTWRFSYKDALRSMSLFTFLPVNHCTLTEKKKSPKMRFWIIRQIIGILILCYS